MLEGETTSEPDVAVPTPEQEVALVELQVNVEEPPGAMLVGFAVNVTVGGGVPVVTVTVAVAVAGGLV